EIQISDISKISGVNYIDNNTDIIILNTVHRKKNYGTVNIYPITYNTLTGKYQRITSYKVEITTRGKKMIGTYSASKSFVPNSVLSSGKWYKIGVVNDGIYKM